MDVKKEAVFQLGLSSDFIPGRNLHVECDADVVATMGREDIAKELLVGFDPIALFIEKLEHRFGHLGWFFADYNGGEVIAVKWNPKVHQLCLKALVESRNRTKHTSCTFLPLERILKTQCGTP